MAPCISLIMSSILDLTSKIRRPLATARGARERRYECSGCGGFEHGLLCGGARSGPRDGAPDRCVFLRDPRATLDIDVRHGGLPFKPLNPLKSLKPLETCQKGLARGCSKMFFYRIRKRRETSRPARQTPQAPQISHQNVFLFFLRDPKATLDIGACPSNPSNPSNPSKLARRGLLEAAPKCFFTGSESDVRHQGLPVKPRKPLKSLIKMCFFTGSKSDVRHRGLPFKPFKPLKSPKSLEPCQKGLARGCFKMCFFYGIQERR